MAALAETQNSEQFQDPSLVEADLGILPAEPNRIGEAPGKVIELSYYQEIAQRLDSRLGMQLLERIQRGDEEAMETMVRRAVPIVHYIASTRAVHLDHEVKFQAGLISIPGALLRFDKTYGARLSTFLFSRIRGAITDEARQQDILSRGDRDILNKIASLEDPQEAKQALHTWATEGISHNGRRPQTPLAIAPSLLQDGLPAHPEISLEEVMTNDENDSQFDKFADTTDVHESVYVKLETKKLFELVAQLSRRERMIVTQFYGLFNTPRRNMREIGDRLGVTESRVSQLNTAAIQKMAQILEVSDGIPFRETD